MDTWKLLHKWINLPYLKYAKNSYLNKTTTPSIFSKWFKKSTLNQNLMLIWNRNGCIFSQIHLKKFFKTKKTILAFNTFQCLYKINRYLLKISLSS